MILTGKKIIEEWAEKKIQIEPFSVEHVTTNTYDLKLGHRLFKYCDDILDPRKKANYTEIIIPEEGYVLKKNSFHLGASFEKVGSDYYVPIIHARSGIARLGLFVHVTADLIDIGYFGNLSFQLYATESIRVYPEMKIAQVSFWRIDGEKILYDGKYQNGEGPQASKTYLDY